MHVFLSGGSGMVGSNVREVFAERGIAFTAPSRQELNLMEYSSIVRFFKREKIDAVVHAAGMVGGIQANMQGNYDFCLTNLQLGINVIQAAMDTGVERLINLGSSCIYPYAAPNPLKEEYLLSDKPEPTNEGYALAKICIAKLASFANQQYGKEYKTLMPCNLYGRWDNFDLHTSHMIPAVVRKIAEAVERQEKEVVIWGQGTARREAMYAGDLADFIAFTLNNYSLIPEMINVGPGYDYSINEFYEIVADVIGYKGGFVHDLTKPVGMEHKLLDVSRLEGLGWKPKHSLAEGIGKTYAFFKDADVRLRLTS